MEVSGSSIATTLGIGSGIDMAGLATQLAEAQFAGRNQRLTTKSETLERQISVAGSIRSSLSLFASAVGDRVRTGDLAAKPTISNSSVATVSAASGSTSRGSYQLEVTQLAQLQTLTGPAYGSAGDTVGAGTLTIRFGAVDNTNFTEDTSNPAVDITIPEGATLADVASAINGQTGLNAYIAQTSSGAQLVIKGSEGAQNGFVIEATENPGFPGLSSLAWQPGSDPQRLVSAAQSAVYKLDGLERTSDRNAIENAAPGLSLVLTGTNAGTPATIAFSKSNSAINTFMNDMIGALNEIVGELRSATDPQTGDLARDSGARTLRRTLSALGSQTIMPNAPEGAPRTLSELGLAVERDGSFRFDAARLERALAQDPDGVAAMFTTGLNGVYATIDRIARSTATTSDPASLAGSIARYQSQTKQVTGDLARLADQQESLRASMVARFARADTQVAASQSTLSFLQSQIDIWNSQRN